MSDHLHLPDPDESGLFAFFKLMLKGIGWLLVIAVVGILLLLGTCVVFAVTSGR